MFKQCSNVFIEVQCTSIERLQTGEFTLNRLVSSRFELFGHVVGLASGLESEEDMGKCVMSMVYPRAVFNAFHIGAADPKWPHCIYSSSIETIVLAVSRPIEANRLMPKKNVNIRLSFVVCRVMVEAIDEFVTRMINFALLASHIKVRQLIFGFSYKNGNISY